MRHRATCPGWSNYPECAVLNGGRLVPFQCHHGTHVASWHEGHPLYVSPDGELSHQGQIDRPF